ncbi:MAG: hypothetical protein J6A69_01985 [Clostridia bacterium]|nr:hypothetical protein [Clostridia bacterium]
MERKYQRQYENFSGVVPRPEDFPVLDNGREKRKAATDNNPKDTSPAHIQSANSFLSNMKLDDILLAVVLILMLTEEEKDMPTIIVLAVLLLSEYL